MAPPLTGPPPVPSAGFTPATRSLLWRLSSRPGLVVLHGHPQTARLAHYFLLAPLLRGERVLFLDAANCFNPHRLARLCSMSYGRQAARAERCRRAPAATGEPEEFLERVYLSRAFTCFQLAELIERTPAAAQRLQARCIVLTGVPDIFDDEELSEAEVKRVFLRALAGVRKWPAMRLTGLVFSGEGVHSRPLRRWLEQQLGRAASGLYRFEEGPRGLCLREEKSNPAALAAGSLRSLRLCGQNQIGSTTETQRTQR